MPPLRRLFHVTKGYSAMLSTELANTEDSLQNDSIVDPRFLLATVNHPTDFSSKSMKKSISLQHIP